MRRRIRFSPGLLGRLLAILLAMLAIEFVTSTWLYERSSRALIRDDEAHRLAEHLVIARKLVSAQPWPERPAMAERLTTDRYDIHWSGMAGPGPVVGMERGDAWRRVIEWEPSLGDGDLRVQLVAVGRSAQLFGMVRLSDNTWLRFRASAPPGEDGASVHPIMIALLPFAALLLVGAFLLRQTLRSMGMLARAADRIGRGGTLTLPEIGPGEVRRVIRAFNAMQTRIRRLIDDRTQALAAVGHDLRTPLARLQLRTDAIADSPLRHAFEGDVAEMEAMVGSLLSYLGGEDDPERPVRIDIAVMAATIVDDAADRGGKASYQGVDHLEATLRPSAIKRAIANLVENALHYGEAARVKVLVEGERLIVRVDDDGPGIPADQIGAVTQPFSRLDPARRRNTGGLGLGLAIVVRAAEAERGTLHLANRPEGGLRAELHLPHRQAEPTPR